MQEDGLDKTGVRRSRLINGMAPEWVTETNEGAMPGKSELRSGEQGNTTVETAARQDRRYIACDGSRVSGTSLAMGQDSVEWPGG